MAKIGTTRLPKGEHKMRLTFDFRTLILRRYVQEWCCVGCGVRIMVKSRNPAAVKLTAREFTQAHTGYITNASILRALLNSRQFAKECGAKLWVDLSEWNQIKLNRGKRK